jgi:hypothetical protein
MKHIVLVILFSVMFFESSGQQLTASRSKKVKYVDGRQIAVGDHIEHGNKVRIDKGGGLTLTYGRWMFHLKPGTYDIDSALDKELQKREFIVDDSIYSVLKNKNLLDCKTASVECMNCSSVFNPKQKKGNVVITKGDSVLLQWNDRPEYNGNYYIVFSTLFEDLLHLVVTDKKEIKISSKPLEKEKAVQYKIISEDCLASDSKILELE